MQVLISGKTSFKIEVPYRLYETGPKGDKPLIVYLHGYNQNLPLFEKLTRSMLDISAYHLYIQGPYPDLDSTRNNKRQGFAWYLYNGNQGAFIKSLEYSSEFIQEIVDGLIPFIDINRLGVLGYSMGGYLAGYFALSRWKHVNDLVVINGRIKTEAFPAKWANRRHIKVLALHGANDDKVSPERQGQAIEFMKEKGLNATFKSLNKGHGLSSLFLKEARKWMVGQGYELCDPGDNKKP